MGSGRGRGEREEEEGTGVGGWRCGDWVAGGVGGRGEQEEGDGGRRCVFSFSTFPLCFC